MQSTKAAKLWLAPRLTKRNQVCVVFGRMRLSWSLIGKFTASGIILQALLGSQPSVANRIKVEIVVGRSQDCSSRLCYLLGPCESRSSQQRRQCKNCIIGTFWDSTSYHGLRS